MQNWKVVGYGRPRSHLRLRHLRIGLGRIAFVAMALFTVGYSGQHFFHFFMAATGLRGEPSIYTALMALAWAADFVVTLVVMYCLCDWAIRSWEH